MSTDESKFLKWLASISAALLIAIAIGAFSVLSSVDVMNERISDNTKEIKETRTTHKEDLILIRNDIKEIKNDTKDIKNILMK